MPESLRHSRRFYTRQSMLRGVWMAIAALLAIMTVSPLLLMLSIAFKGQGEVFSTNLIPEAPTLANFVYVFTEVNFLRYLFNSFVVSASITIIALLFHSMAGYALARLRFPGRDFIFLAMFSTFLVSLPVIIIPLFVLVRFLGLLNSYAGLIIPLIFNAFGIFLFRQYYLTFPKELEEAAVLDGAGYWFIYWKIILPLSRSILASLAILFFLVNWNAFIWPLTITSDQSLWVVQVAISTFSSQHNSSWNYIMAASTIVTLPMVVIFLFFQRQVMDSLVTSGLK